MSDASSKRPPLRDQAVRDEFVRELDTSFVIEAGAGTGKTTLIIDRIVAHVLRGDPIDSIVAITFTKKAAAELRIRVRVALEAKAASASGEEAARIAAALRGVDMAPIQTIHSFAQSLLRERPVESKLDPGAETLEEAQVARLCAQAFEAELDALEADPAFSKEVVELLASGVQPTALRDLTKLAIRSREIAAPPPLPLTPEALAVPRGSIEALLDDLIDRVNDGVKTRPDTLADAAFEAEAVLRRILSSEPDVLRRDLFDCPRRSGRAKGAEKKWTSKTAKQSALAAYAALHDHLDEWRGRVCQHRAAVAWRFALRVAARYEAKKVELGAIDFDDQLVKARDLVRDHVNVRREFAARYRTLFVDEFQDTDPLQAELAFFLAEAEGEAASDWRRVRVGPGRLVLVGDPKQSIYGFRRADIQIYQEAKRVLAASGGLVRDIQVNFRSAAPILRFVNEWFAEAITPDPDHPDEQPIYVPLLPPPAPIETGPCVVVLEEAGSDSFPTQKSQRTESEATALAAYLGQLVRGAEPRRVRDVESGGWRTASWSDVAILYRTTTALETFEIALVAERIPYRIVGGRHFFERFEVRAALALLRVLDDPTDEVALIALLRGPFFAIADHELADYVASGGRFAEIDAKPPATIGLRAALDRVRALRQRRHGRSIAGFIEEAFVMTHAHEIFTLQPEGEQRSANLGKIVSLARALERKGTSSFREFVDEVARRAADAEREADAEFLDEGEDAVTLITMHSSKGLEWPIVVLADLGAKGRTVEKRFVERLPQPSVQFSFGDKSAPRAATCEIDRAAHDAQRRVTFERRRLLYVAATRARDLLVLPRYHSPPTTSKKRDSDKTGRPIVEELRGNAFFGGAEREYGIRVDAAQVPRAEPEDRTLRVDLRLTEEMPAEAVAALAERERFASDARAMFERAGAGRAVTSATAEKALAKREEHDDATERSSRERALPTDGPHGSTFGSFVHAIFERLDLRAKARLDPEIMAALVSEFGLGPEAVGAAERIVEAFYGTPFADSLVKAKRFLHEAPFAFPDDDRIIEGSIDLIAEHEDGRLWVVDWKTDDVSGSELDRRFESYRFQADTYRRAVSAATGRSPERVVFYFLRSGECRELPRAE